jgi:hypothetical protein
MTLDYILNKYNLEVRDVIAIPNVDRFNLSSLLHELDFKVGVEIGVQAGRYSENLCINNPQMKLYGVDKWEEYLVNPYLGSKTNQKDHNMFYQRASKKLKKYSNYEIIKAWSMDVVQQFADESLDFVYIDGNHDYGHTMEDIVEWSKKVKVGGIVSGHDYYNAKRNHNATVEVKKAVNDYVRTHTIKPLIIWGASEMIPGILREHSRSWSFVKI